MKAARFIEASTPVASINMGDASVLLVDLNNFASFPTLAIGLLTASLRNAGFRVQLISPLAHDVPAAEREHAERYVHHLQRRVHLSTWAPFTSTRDAIRATRYWWRNRPHPRVLAEVGRALEDRPAAILLSAYLQHYATVAAIGRMARAAGVPLILGGPAFSTDNTNDYWRRLPGLAALVGAEVDLSLPDIVRAVCRGGPLDAIPGVVLPDGRRGPPAAPLRPLDASPVPDFTDFPWHRYRTRIVPLMASRGCQWARCTFCSDIVSVSGRVFRSRGVESVLHEMREQARRHETTNFLFLDLKLNSNPHLFRGIIENVQRNVRGAQWIGTVHVDRRPDNGLARDELRAASAAGMRRISFGLESGSQRLLDAMDKGSDVEGNAQFVRYAHEAGISVRATMFKGFPGETAADLEATARFLEANGRYMDRIRYNEFSIPTDTSIQRDILANPDAYPDWEVIEHSGRHARIRYRSAQGHARDYRRAKARVLALVHTINRRKIRSSARAFDGLM